MTGDADWRLHGTFKTWHLECFRPASGPVMYTHLQLAFYQQQRALPANLGC